MGKIIPKLVPVRLFLIIISMMIVAQAGCSNQHPALTATPTKPAYTPTGTSTSTPTIAPTHTRSQISTAGHVVAKRLAPTA